MAQAKSRGVSRFRRFAHSLASGYVLLAANTLFTLASVPLALHYLSKAEFGLWALTTQVAGYLALIDGGMAGAATRLFIDHKDEHEGQTYASLVLTSALVGLGQGVLIMAAGGALAYLVPVWFDVGAELSGKFRWLMAGQAVLLAVLFMSRVLGNVLIAHQRFDISNYAAVVSFGVNFGVLWFFFARGHGVLSLLWAQAAAAVVNLIAAAAACVHLRLLPKPGRRGRATWPLFRQLLSFGSTIFLFTVGSLMISASQTILVTAVMGLEAGAVWSVCTRAFQLAGQMTNRIFDFSSSTFAEMIVRRERDRLFGRFKAVVAVSTLLAIVAGTALAVGNAPFVELWTRGRIGWPWINDLLLGIWLCVLVQVRNHTGLVGQTKEFGFLRYIYFIEGAFAVGFGWLGLRWGGFTGMLVASICASLLFSFPYGIWRTGEYFGLGWLTVAGGWNRGPARTALVLVPVAALVWWITRAWSPVWRLVVCTAVVGGVGIWLAFALGLDKGLRGELHRRFAIRRGSRHASV